MNRTRPSAASSCGPNRYSAYMLSSRWTRSFVQEGRGQQPVVLPGGDPDRLVRPSGRTPARRRRTASRSRTRCLEHERDHVEPDQDLADPARVVADPSAEERPRLAYVLVALPDALGALETDRRRDHAVRADPPLAAGAADVGLAVGVAVAGRRLRGQRDPAGPARRRSGGWTVTGSEAQASRRSTSTVVDHDVLDRAVHAAGRCRGDPVDDLAAAAVGDLAEDGVLAVQVRRRADGDEELRAVGARGRRWPSPAGRAGRTAARGGTRRRTGSRGRRCRCPAGHRPGS